MRLANIGFGNMVAAARIIAVVAPDSAPARRLVMEARDTGRVIDATSGRRTRSVIMMDSGHVVLSPLQPETVAGRMEGRGKGTDEEAEG